MVLKGNGLLLSCFLCGYHVVVVVLIFERFQHGVLGMLEFVRWVGAGTG